MVSHFPSDKYLLIKIFRKIVTNVHTQMTRFNKMYGKLKQGGMNMSHSYQSGFALLVVLFILLVIIGASWAY